MCDPVLTPVLEPTGEEGAVRAVELGKVLSTRLGDREQRCARVGRVVVPLDVAAFGQAADLAADHRRIEAVLSGNVARTGVAVRAQIAQQRGVRTTQRGLE